MKKMQILQLQKYNKMKQQKNTITKQWIQKYIFQKQITFWWFISDLFNFIF